MSIDILTLAFALSMTALAAATPLIFVTLGETLTQRTGVINLGIEGEMLFGACFGFGATMATGNPWLGLAVGALSGAALSLVHAGLVLGARANQIASGIAVWIVGLGVTSYAGRRFVGGQVTPPPRPDSSALREVPVIGAGLSQIGVTAILAVIAVAIAAWWLAHTRTGLVWRASGESAMIARENGLNPMRARFLAILTGGALAGFGGGGLVDRLYPDMGAGDHQRSGTDRCRPGDRGAVEPDTGAARMFRVRAGGNRICPAACCGV